MGSDLAKVLEYRDASNALRSVRDKYKGTQIVSTQSGQQEYTVVSESGVYQLIMRSRAKNAERFQDWVCEEVLPSIRKTGGYGNQLELPKTLGEAMRLAADTQLELEAQQAQLAIAAPKAEVYDACMDQGAGVSANAVAKAMEEDGYAVNTKTVRKMLHDAGLIFNEGGAWLPFAGAVRAGLAASRMDTNKRGRFTVALITPAGITHFRNWLNANGKRKVNR